MGFRYDKRKAGSSVACMPVPFQFPKMAAKKKPARSGTEAREFIDFLRNSGGYATY
jgi:hypothetical protein